jgi:hypothetical protein
MLGYVNSYPNLELLLPMIQFNCANKHKFLVSVDYQHNSPLCQLKYFGDIIDNGHQEAWVHGGGGTG